jgi:hypothetical protein
MSYSRACGRTSFVEAVSERGAFMGIVFPKPKYVCAFLPYRPISSQIEQLRACILKIRGHGRILKRIYGILH